MKAQHKPTRVPTMAATLPDRAAQFATMPPVNLLSAPTQASATLSALRDSVAAEIRADAREKLDRDNATAKALAVPYVPVREVIKPSLWTAPNGPRGESLGVLLQMLETKRPYKSSAPQDFARRWLAPLGARPDAEGNWILRIGADSTVCWSSHTDTVHWHAGVQRVSLRNDVLRLSRHSQKLSECLGADCTAGVWLMREMVKAKRPGLYIWHAGEERGGIGSSHIAHKTPELLTGITKAIAFDRRGTHSVITHQGFDRCCSDAFGRSLAAALAMGHKLDDTGSFTDTANFTDLVAECTNLSVGYYFEHTDNEQLDVPYLFALRDALLSLDAESLTVARRPGEVESHARYGAPYYGNATSYSVGKPQARGYASEAWDSLGNEESASGDDDLDSLIELVRANPRLAAEFLDSYGVDAFELGEYIYTAGGFIPRRMLGGKQ